MTQPNKFDIFVNRRSGAVLKAGEDRIVKDLRTIFGDAAGEIRLLEGAELAPAVRQWLASGQSNNGHSLIIGGGDGSLLTAAAEVMGSNAAIGVLPLGTQNFIARQLGYSADYREAAAQYRHSTSRTIDVGTVNGMNFLFGFVFNKGSVDIFQARENARNKNYGATIDKAFASAAGILLSEKSCLRLVTGSTEEQVVEGRIFAVTNNVIVPRANSARALLRPGTDSLKKVIGNTLAKAENSDGQLAFYAHRGGARLAFLLPKLWDGSWNKSASVTFKAASAMRIEPLDLPKNQPVTLVLDGEIRETAFPLNVSIRPQALRLYRPA